MTYSVDSTRVDAEVEQFSDRLQRSWNACIAQIAADPHPRFGTHVDRVIPIVGFPMRTWVYEIVEETNRLSGEIVFVFTADFFPEYAPVYAIDEGSRTVIMLFLRDNRRA